jgi:uncharacterized delta-60 repeat protein
VVRKRRLAAVLASACWAFVVPIAQAVTAPADLDRSFGGDGIVEVEGAGGPVFPKESAARMAVGPHDEVIVVHSSYAPCTPLTGCTVELGLSRYDAAGKRDPSYGVGPGSQLPVRQYTEDRHGFELAIGPDGKAVVAASDAGREGVIVARFDAGGHLDPTFGTGGIAPQPVGVLHETPVALAVQSDGKIVVAGSGSMLDGGQELVVVRYLATGELDPSFGDSGKAVLPLPTQSRPAGLLLDPVEGQITVAAPLCCVGGTSLFGEGFSVARLLDDGRPDSGLGGSGLLFLPTPGAEGSVEAAAAAPEGGVLVVFEESTDAGSTVGNVVKLSADGSIDGSFGNGGRIRLAARVGGIDPTDLVVDANWRLNGTGWGEGGVSVFRLRADGRVDRTFNGGSQLLASRGGRGLEIALQSSGRIVVLANRSLCCGPQRFVLVGVRGGTDRPRCLGKGATIVGTRRADELTGTPRRDVIAALAGKDKVRGLAGADLICGGKGQDSLGGGPGRDTVQQDPLRRRLVR